MKRDVVPEYRGYARTRISGQQQIEENVKLTKNNQRCKTSHDYKVKEGVLDYLWAR